MRRLIKTYLLALIASLAMAHGPVLAGDPVGVRNIETPSAQRGSDLTVTVWYPSTGGGTPLKLGENRLFVGTPALLDAPLSGSRHPLIMLSHGAGLGGTPEAASWIASALAERGFVVAAPAHPGSGGPSRSASEIMKLWLRPGDISATIDSLQTDPGFQDHIDWQRVGALGLSMGGNTVLSLAGARIDKIRLANYCDRDVNPSLCGWVRQSGVDLHAMDMGDAEEDNRDSRIRFAMVVDPAPVDVFIDSTFSNVPIGVAIVNLGRPGSIPTTALASRIARIIPNATYDTVADASHFSMFAQCRPGLDPSAVETEIGDPVCTDGGGRSRRDIHDQLIDMAAEAFGRALTP